MSFDIECNINSLYYCSKDINGIHGDKTSIKNDDIEYEILRGD